MTSGSTSRSASAFTEAGPPTRLLGALAIVAMLNGEADAASPTAVEAEHGMVVSAQHYASEIGAGILAQGGNAIDAAVAVGYALAVVDPCCGNIGGGGFMTIHLKDGRDTFINFRETAPAAATAAMYLDADGQPINELSRSGYRAAGVPGTVMGLERAAQKYGRLARPALLAPAITLARYGYVLGRGDTDILDGKRSARQGPGRRARFFCGPTAPALCRATGSCSPSWRRRSNQIAEQGPDAFYRGPIPTSVAKASSENGGILTAQDFADYTVTESAPLTCSYRGYRIAVGAAAELGRDDDM